MLLPPPVPVARLAAAPSAALVAKIPFATNIAFRRGTWVTSGAGGPQSSDGVWYVPKAGAAPRHVVRGLPEALGLAWYRGWLYVSYARTFSSGRVVAFRNFDGHGFKRRRVVIGSLPIGRHALDTIAPGPDGRLYMGAGSENDNTRSAHRTAGSVVSFRPSGGGVRIVASGLRNPFGVAFVPGTHHLLVTNNGRDDLGPGKPPDTLFTFTPGKAVPNFGFPGCYGQGGAACRGARRQIFSFAPHASSDGIAVSKPGRGGAFTAYVAENGSSNPAAPTGDDIIRLRLTPHGGSYRVTGGVFARGFAKFDPLGAALGPDGRLYVTLFSSGKVVRYDL